MDVVIESDENDKFGLYNSAGQCIEADFDSEEEAEQYAKDNHYRVVQSFNFF